jgi:TP901 family phage tail tape measure protein
MAEPLAFDIIARDRASDTTKRIGKSFGNLKASTVGAFAGMSAAVTNFALNQLSNAARAVKDFVVDSVRQFAAFDTSMREVWTLLPDLSAAGFASMQDDVRTFTKEMGVATTDAVPALYQAISSGVPPENVFDFLTSAAKLSIGGVTTLETAVDGLTSVTNAYGKENLSAEKASDLFFTAVKLGKTTVGELSTSLFQVVPTAAALGIGFETVTAALAAMTVQGVPTAVATTQLRQLFVELNKEGGKAAATFQDLSGKSFANFVRDGGSVQEALALMAEHAKDGNTSLSNLFGSVEAGNAALALTSESGAAAFNSALGEMAESSGATDEAFGRMDEGIGRSWDKLKVRIDDLKLSLGEKLAPALEGVLDWFEQIGDNSEGLGDTFKVLGDTAETQLGKRVVPELESFAGVFQDTMVQNEQGLTEFTKLAGVLIAGQINFWKQLQFAWNAAAGLFATILEGMIGVALFWADATLTSAQIAFGWIPGIGSKLKDLRGQMTEFRQRVNAELDKIRPKVDINIHTRFTTSGAPPTAIGGGSQSVFFGQHGGEVPGPFTGIDRVPAMLTAGEWVVDRPTAQSNRALLANLTPGGSAAGGGQSTTVVIEIRSGGSRWDDALVEAVARAVRVRGGNAQLVLGTGG